MDFTFTLTDQEANLVLEALGQMPLNKSMGVFFKLREQAQKQVNAQPAELPDTPKPATNSHTQRDNGGDNAGIPQER